MVKFKFSFKIILLSWIFEIPWKLWFNFQLFRAEKRRKRNLVTNGQEVGRGDSSTSTKKRREIQSIGDKRLWRLCASASSCRQLCSAIELKLGSVLIPQLKMLQFSNDVNIPSFTNVFLISFFRILLLWKLRFGSSHKKYINEYYMHPCYLKM